MRLIGIVGSVLIAGSAFASVDHHHSGTFEGHGRWKSADGKSGKYTVQLTASHGDDGTFEATNTYSYKNAAGETESKSYTFKAVGKEGSKGFYDVKIGDAVVGDGFCFKHVCQYSFTYQGVTISESATIVHDMIFRTGSETSSDRAKIAWTEWLHKKKDGKKDK